jgi:hypothetical protein
MEGYFPVFEGVENNGEINSAARVRAITNEERVAKGNTGCTMDGLGRSQDRIPS